MNLRPWEGAPEPAPTPYLHSPRFSPDGRTLAFVYAGDIWLVDSGGGDARLVVSHSAYNDRPRFSPDGRWVSFDSDESGRTDVYVVPFNGSAGKIPVSTAGGTEAHWRRDGTWRGDERSQSGGLNTVAGSDFHRQQSGTSRP